jgi:phage gp36-like protein
MPSYTLPVSYGTVDGVQQNVARIGSVTTITSATYALFLGKTEAVMNAMLAQQFTLPFTTNVPLLTVVSEDVSTYYVLRRLFMEQIPNKSDWVEKFEEASILLDDVLTGMAVLLDVNATPVAPRNTIWSNTQGYTPTMSEIPAEWWYMDPNKLMDKLNAHKIGDIFVGARLL